MRFIFFMGLLCLALPVFPGNFQSSDARSAAMGGTSVCNADAFTLLYNPAGVARLKKPAAGISYRNYFLVKDIASRSFVCIYPAARGMAGFSAIFYGNGFYSERKLSLSYAKAFGDKLSAGITFSYQSVIIAGDYGSLHRFTAEGGIRARLSRSLTFGMYVFNPARQKLAAYNDERMPSVMRLGVLWELSAKVGIAAEAEKDISGTADIKTGIEYRPVKSLYLRAGISTAAPSFSFGFGVEYSSLRADLAASLHPSLGYSPKLSLVYTFK